MVKHETEYDVSDAKGFNPELRGNLEAQITNVADEMAYTAHDLDDGLRSNMITMEHTGWIGAMGNRSQQRRLARKPDG